MNSKTHTIIALILVTISFSSYSQINCRKDILITPYYGFPNWSELILKPELISNSQEGSTFKSYGPSGIRFSYFNSAKWEFGVDLIVNGYSFKGNFLSDSTFSLATNTYTPSYTKINYFVNRFRIQARANYHFLTQSTHFDHYIGFAIGSNTRIETSFSSSQDTTENKQFNDFVENKIKTTTLSKALIPFSARICYGISYFFTPDYGINAEFGLGGPTFSIGISMRY